MSIQYCVVMVSFLDSLDERGDYYIKIYSDLNVFILLYCYFFPPKAGC